MFGSIHEECGVFGIFDPSKKLNVTQITYSGLYALQHRGQQSCGIAVNNEGKIYNHNDEGLLNEVFNEMILNYLKGNIALGHVRYASADNKGRENNLPYVSKYTKGQIAISYNGSLVNSNSMRSSLEDSGAMFHTNSDAEIFAYMISRERLKTESTEQAIINIMPKVSGAYSFSIMTPNKLIAVRDPKGFRPLCIGKLKDAYIISSESCAIDAVGGDFVRDIAPGEVVVITEDGIQSRTDNCGKEKTSCCIFEHIYFARPDSVIDGQSVHFARQEAGKCLARRDNDKNIADIVIGVPDSGLDAALGYANESGIPYGVGLNKNRYIGRTFIQTQQGERENLVRLKLNPMPAVLKGKRVIIVDDSIVRGTTVAHLIELVRHAGATEVHLRISSPPFLNPCYFGTDIDSKDKLIANRLTLDEIRQAIGADSLAYLAVEDLKSIIKDNNLDFCDACFTGNYPVHVPGEN